jgi:hypothetical protein
LLDVYDIYRVTIRIVVIIVGRRELWEGFDSVGIVGKQLSKLRSNTCVSARKKARVGEGTTSILELPGQCLMRSPFDSHILLLLLRSRPLRLRLTATTLHQRMSIGP